MKYPIRITSDECRMMVKDHRGWECTNIDPVPPAQAVCSEMGQDAFVYRLFYLTLVRQAVVR